MQNLKRIGNTDRPVESYEKDEFQIEAYISGLSEFIEECETPMTIAVQGDWGCGKNQYDEYGAAVFDAKGRYHGCVV